MTRRWFVDLWPAWLSSISLLLLSTVAVCQEIHFGEQEFDRVTFSQMSQLEARQKCDQALQESLQRIAGAVTLTPPIQDKLLAAGRIDIHRFFAEYDRAKRQITFGNVAKDRWQQISSQSHADVKPLKLQFLQGLHGNASLFDKTLTTTLNADSLTKVRETESQWARANYSEQIDTALLVVSRQVALKPEQRTAIKEMLLVETEPPAMFGTSPMPLYFVLANMGEIEDDLRALFSEQDFQTLGKLIEAGRSSTRN